MKQERKIIPLKDLNLTDRFLFDTVMEDLQTQQDILSIIFGKEIPLLEKGETEKELRISPLLHSIRMDMFTMSEDQVIYNTEMQKKRKNDLAKRSRFYQSLIDSALLAPGVPDYNLLRSSFIIMIMPFDLFGFGRYQYTFYNVCKEEPECTLDDGTVRIFLNTRGTRPEGISKELIDFLHYLENTTDLAAQESSSDRIQRIHRQVCKAKRSEEVGIKYMQAWEELYYEREEGREEGLKEARKEARKEREQLITNALRTTKSVTQTAAILQLDEEEVKKIAEKAGLLFP